MIYDNGVVEIDGEIIPLYISESKGIEGYIKSLLLVRMIAENFKKVDEE